jgi:hypothetical protein
MLKRIIAVRGMPKTIRCDDGAEFTSCHFLAWALEWTIELAHTQPGTRRKLHGRLREECLRTSWLANLFDARKIIVRWTTEQNEPRPIAV